MTTYGLRMYNIYGNINLTDDSYTLRLHEKGIVEVPGLIAWNDPGEVTVNFTGVSFIPILTIQDIDETDWSVNSDTYIHASFVPLGIGETVLSQIQLQNYGLA